MPPIRPCYSTNIPGLDWLTTDDGSLTLWDSQLQETYHSGCGAVAESLVVYLVHSGVYRRLIRSLPTSVFEMGLGTGTNLLLTGALAEHLGTPLEYWAIENRLLPSSVFDSLQLSQHLPQAINANQSLRCFQNSNEHTNSLTSKADQILPGTSDAKHPISMEHFSKLAELSSGFSQWVAQLTNRGHTSAPNALPVAPLPVPSTSLSPLQHRTWSFSSYVTVHLLMGDALEFIDSSQWDQHLSRFDTVYFDPFSPESNPELWTEPMLRAMYQLLQPGGTLTSYCVKSRIRHLLKGIGFTVDKVSGPAGGKREVLRAIKRP